MKRIIDGQTYNTDTATLCAERKLTRWGGRGETGQGMLTAFSWTEALYRSGGGAFFLVTTPDAPARSMDQPELTPIGDKQALAWAEEHCTVEQIEALFGEMPEAGAKSAPMYLRIPDVLKKQIEVRAKAEKLSANAWMIRCAESCLKTRSI